jgi:hypothetical protein
MGEGSLKELCITFNKGPEKEYFLTLSFLSLLASHLCVHWYSTQLRGQMCNVHRTLEKLSPINLMCCFLKRVGLFCGGCSHMAS